MNSIPRNRITPIDEGESVIKQLQLIFLERMAELGGPALVTRAEITHSDDHGKINPLIGVRQTNAPAEPPEARGAVWGGTPVPRVEPE